jgi:16S rRNA (cytosine1402-N4)-methyltransferase
LTVTTLTRGNALGHEPVMLEEVIGALDVHLGGRYVDCTVGAGGHAAAILEDSSPGGQLIGIDADPKVIAVAAEALKRFEKDVLLVNENFKHLDNICARHGFRPVSGVLFDLGMSSLQLGESGRGFSFQQDGPLDMRFSEKQSLTAADIVNDYPEDELARIIYEYGEERRSRQIARRIVRRRPLGGTAELARVVEQAVGGSRGRIHPATRTFQALRIAVNEELENLGLALDQAVNLLGCGGRIVVISFHSLEDRITKEFFRREALDCICPPRTPECVCGHTARLRLVSRKAVRPSPLEVQANPRSRSARMRAAERL